MSAKRSLAKTSRRAGRPAGEIDHIFVYRVYRDDMLKQLSFNTDLIITIARYTESVLKKANEGNEKFNDI